MKTNARAALELDPELALVLVGNEGCRIALEILPCDFFRLGQEGRDIREPAMGTTEGDGTPDRVIDAGNCLDINP